MGKDKEERMVEGLGNGAILMILGGIFLMAMAGNVTTMFLAAALIVFGCFFCILSGYALERMQPEKEEGDELDANYMYQPEYSFIEYLKDSSSTITELLDLMDDNPNPTILFYTVYLNYTESAAGARVQSKQQIWEMLERERRYRNGRNQTA